MCCRSEWQERMYIYKWHEVDQTKHEIFCVHIVCNEIQVKVNLEITTFFFYLRFPYCPNFFWFGVVFHLKKHSFTVSYFCVSAVNIMHGFSLRDVQALGVNLLGHQRKIVNAAKQLRTHLTQGHVEVWCFHIVLTQQCMLGDLVPQPVAAHKNTGIEMRMTKKPWVKKKIFIMNYLPICPTLPCWTVVFYILLLLTPSFSVALPLTF